MRQMRVRPWRLHGMSTLGGQPLLLSALGLALSPEFIVRGLNHLEMSP